MPFIFSVSKDSQDDFSLQRHEECKLKIWQIALDSVYQHISVQRAGIILKNPLKLVI